MAAMAQVVHARQPVRGLWHRVRPWLPFVVVGVLLWLLVKAVHPGQLASAIKQYDWLYLLPLGATYLLYLGLRALRWHLLMRPLHVPNTVLDSLLLFTGAQAALLVPAGQFLLPVLQKSQYRTLIRRSAATVLIQELLFGIFVLPAGIPGVSTMQLAWLLALAFAVSIAAGAAILIEPVASFVLRLCSRIPFLTRHIPGFRDLREHVAFVARTPEAILGSTLDMAAIAAAGTSFYIALIGLGQTQAGWPGAMATYAFGVAAGTVTSLPGGLGANEDASTAVLAHLGVAAAPAAAATLIFRAFSLLLGTAVGWLVLLSCRRRFNIGPNLAAVISASSQGEEEAVSGNEPVRPEADPATRSLRP